MPQSRVYNIYVCNSSDTWDVVIDMEVFDSEYAAVEKGRRLHLQYSRPVKVYIVEDGRFRTVAHHG